MALPICLSLSSGTPLSAGHSPALATDDEKESASLESQLLAFAAADSPPPSTQEYAPDSPSDGGVPRRIGGLQRTESLMSGDFPSEDEGDTGAQAIATDGGTASPAPTVFQLNPPGAKAVGNYQERNDGQLKGARPRPRGGF